MKYLIVLPVVDEVATDRCVASLAPEMLENTLIIDNSSSDFAKKYKGASHLTFGENIGVPRSWNKGLRTFDIDPELEYVVILSATIAFNSHDDARSYVNALNNVGNEYGMETQHGWHLIAIGRKTYETIGLFDENFFPAYYEDSDYIRRMELAGIHLPMSKTQRLPFHTIGAEHHGNAHAIKSGIKVNIDACLQYFKEKWGFEPRYESQAMRDKMYDHPFNNPELPLSYWPLTSIEDLKVKYEL